MSFRRADGSFRKARAWVDTGGGWFAVTERLAKDFCPLLISLGKSCPFYYNLKLTVPLTRW